jgi:hypothetical protein
VVLVQGPSSLLRLSKQYSHEMNSQFLAEKIEMTIPIAPTRQTKPLCCSKRKREQCVRRWHHSCLRLSFPTQDITVLLPTITLT